MKTAYVVDASVAVKWFVPEVHKHQGGEVHGTILNIGANRGDAGKTFS